MFENATFALFDIDRWGEALQYIPAGLSFACISVLIGFPWNVVLLVKYTHIKLSKVEGNSKSLF